MAENSFLSCELKLADIPVSLALRFPQTTQYLKKYVIDNPDSSVGKISVPSYAFRDWGQTGSKQDAFSEFCLFCQPVSEYLLEHDRCVFHAAALRAENKAFLIAGGSGSGKSTRTKALLEHYPDEISVINGDKPILEYRENQIHVHPSPWNGKEGLHGAPKSLLAGLFFLKREEGNSLQECTQKEAAILTFPLIFQSFETEHAIRKAAEMTEHIVRNTRCFLLKSNDAGISSELIYQKIKELLSDDV